MDFPGYVPMVDLSPEENSNRWLIKTAKAVYRLDVKRLALELLETTSLPIPSPSPDEKEVLRQFELIISPLSQGIKKYIYSDNRIYLLKNGQLGYLDL